MKLELVTLAGVKMSEEVYQVILPTASGEIGVYPGHEPLVTLAVPGVVRVLRVKGDANEEVFAIHGGLVEVNQERIRILVDEAEHADDIVEAEAEAAAERAKKLLSEAKDQVTISEAQAMLNRQAVRLKVAGLRRRRHHS